MDSRKCYGVEACPGKGHWSMVRGELHNKSIICRQYIHSCPKAYQIFEIKTCKIVCKVSTFNSYIVYLTIIASFWYDHHHPVANKVCKLQIKQNRITVLHAVGPSLGVKNSIFHKEKDVFQLVFV